jgi:hypothetical protein
MKQKLSTTDAAAWLWESIKQQGYDPAQYMPWEALREMSELQAFYPKHPAILWFQFASVEAQHVFLTWWYQKLQQKRHGEESAQ